MQSNESHLHQSNNFTGLLNPSPMYGQRCDIFQPTGLKEALDVVINMAGEKEATTVIEKIISKRLPELNADKLKEYSKYVLIAIKVPHVTPYPEDIIGLITRGFRESISPTTTGSAY